MRSRSAALPRLLRCLIPECLGEFDRTATKAVLLDGSSARWGDRPQLRREAVAWSGAQPACPHCDGVLPEALLDAEQVLTVALVAPARATKTHLIRWLRPSLESGGPAGGPPRQVLPSLGWTATLDGSSAASWSAIMKTTTPWILETTEEIERTSGSHLWPFVLHPTSSTGDVGTRTVLVQLYDSDGDHLDHGHEPVELADVITFLIPPEVFSDADAKRAFEGVARAQLDNAMRMHQRGDRNGARPPDLVFVLSKADHYGKGDLPALPADAYRSRVPHDPERGEDLGAAIAADSEALFRWLRRHHPGFVSELMTMIRGVRPGTVWFTAVGGLGPDQAGHLYTVGPTTRTLDPILVALGRAGLIGPR